MDKEKLATDLQDTVDAAFKELSHLLDEHARKQPVSGEWSIKEIVGHLIDSASNNHQRWLRLQISKDLRFPDYGKDNLKWVEIQKYNDQPWKSLLQLWQVFNTHLSTMIRNVNTECLEHIWAIDEDHFITLEGLMVDYLRHLKVHLEQIFGNTIKP